VGAMHEPGSSTNMSGGANIRKGADHAYSCSS
jgi:hypothetical protein